MSDYPEWASLRELDGLEGVDKGCAFRAFKRLEAGLVEGRDYALLHHGDDAVAIAALRRAGRIYASSVNIVLLAPALVPALRAAMRDGRGRDLP
ncbi:MAG TPA: hypothetical protein VM074_10345 [Solimonas sp.]|nr:hypothetical protein [Solimonas sp.]